MSIFLELDLLVNRPFYSDDIEQLKNNLADVQVYPQRTITRRPDVTFTITKTIQEIVIEGYVCYEWLDVLQSWAGAFENQEVLAYLSEGHSNKFLRIEDGKITWKDSVEIPDPDMGWREV
jgi:hypothetical protein